MKTNRSQSSKTSTSSPSGDSALVPEPALRRLPWYLSYVSMLRRKGVEYVSSTRISSDLNVDSSRIAKDLSFLDLKGKTRIGYDVKHLETALNDFLGFRQIHNAVIMGCGSLGAALMQDRGLTRYGLNILAGIDTDPNIVATKINGIPVYEPSRLHQLVESMDIDIGILTVPPSMAGACADMLVQAGVRAVWNFTPMHLSLPDGVVVSNTSIYANLAVMYNRLSRNTGQ